MLPLSAIAGLVLYNMFFGKEARANRDAGRALILVRQNDSKYTQAELETLRGIAMDRVKRGALR